MYSSHKVVAYPSSALRLSLLAAQRAESVMTVNTSYAVEVSHHKDSYLLPNVSKTSTSPLSPSRPRSLSAGRMRPSANDIVQEVYDRLGVSRADLMSSDEGGNSGGSSAVVPSPSFTSDNHIMRNNPTSAALRGRSRQPVKATAVAVSNETTDFNQRRTRSLSRGRIRTLWPPGSQGSQGSAERANSPKRPKNGNGNGSMGSSRNGKSNCSSLECCEEKKDESEAIYDAVGMSMSLLDVDNDTIPVTTPSVKERLRLYGECLVADQLEKLNTRSSMMYYTRKSSTDHFVGTSFTNRNSKNGSRFEIGGSSKDDEDQPSTSTDNTKYVNETSKYQTDISKLNIDTSKTFLDSSKPLTDAFKPFTDISKPFTDTNKPVTDTVKNIGDVSKNATDTFKYINVNHDKVMVHSANTNEGQRNLKRGHVAEAFLAAISPKPAVLRKTSFAPVMEIQTSVDDNETQADTVSISMSSVSVDDYSRGILSDQALNNPNTHVHINHIGTGNLNSSPGNFGVRRNRNSPTDCKKITITQNERDRLLPYRPPTISTTNKLTSRHFEPPASPKFTDRSSLSSFPQTNTLPTNSSNDAQFARVEQIIEEKVNARIIEYETKMEKLILKCMQSVDDKLTSRINNMETRFLQATTVLRKLQNEQRSKARTTTLPDFLMKDTVESISEQQQVDRTPSFNLH